MAPPSCRVQRSTLLGHGVAPDGAERSFSGENTTYHQLRLTWFATRTRIVSTRFDGDVRLSTIYQSEGRSMRAGSVALGQHRGGLPEHPSKCERSSSCR